jgi:hypothetical protein
LLEFPFMRPELESRPEFESRNVMKQRGQLVKDIPDFKIKPDDIDVSKGLWDAYGNSETETSAYWIIKMCQKNGSWNPFTEDDIEKFYASKGMRDGFIFNQLVNPGTGFFIKEGYVPVGGGWIVKKDGKYHVTTAFVEAAHASSPANSKK